MDQEGGQRVEIFEKPVELRNLDAFKKTFIEANRGKPLFLIRFEHLEGMPLGEFIAFLRNEVHSILDLTDVEFGFHYMERIQCLLMGISPIHKWSGATFPNVDSSIGRFHLDCLARKVCTFHFGVGRSQCNFISDNDEIFDELYRTSEKNLKDNLTRWSWTYFNRANTYISDETNDAMIQPTVTFDPRTGMYGVNGGEVFVGGGIYSSYRELIGDIPPDQDLNRIELLILEKLVIACEGAPGLLKFNISPQSLIDTFGIPEKVNRLYNLILSRGLSPRNIRLELVEKPYEEKIHSLKEVCGSFFNFGVTFAADDFGVKSQSHQVVLDLGVMIKEFKLDPISFRFKVEEDQTKFLDNLAFIDYCKRLADNREAGITAEAVEDFDTLRFLMEHQIYQFQTNLFSGKISLTEYRERFAGMRNLPEEAVRKILTDRILLDEVRAVGNIFSVASRVGYM
ncbi:MAG: EAL domain-containing protein [Leptospirales bacterium]|nr:EAL domain-containing protein [Leptospirales bacterium]